MTGWYLLSGLVLFTILMLGFPLLVNIIYSVSDVSFANIRSPQWLGVDHYAKILTNAAFWQAMGFSLKFGVVATVIEVGVAYIMVLALEPILRKHPRWMALILLPMMISPALIANMYRLLLNEFVGYVPQYLALLGWYPDLLGREWVFTTVVAIEVLQWTPFAFVILLAAYQAIPGELYEAALIDGAGPLANFRYLTFPLMVPSLAICFFIRFVDSFRVFDHIFVLTGGGPGTDTTSISIFIYRTFFRQVNLGEAIASSLILLALSLILLWGGMKLILRGSTQ